MRRIRIDGVEYRVNLKYASLVRSFSIMEGQNQGEALTGRTIRDVIGTRYEYELGIEQDPDYPYDYDKFYETITSPVESHIITFPYGQTTYTYECYITEGQDTYMGFYGNMDLWEGLTVHFTAIEPKENAVVDPTVKYLDTQTITPTTENIILSPGYYLTGPQTILGDEDLIPKNIVHGKTIFGVTGITIPEGALIAMSETSVHEAFLEGWNDT